MKALIILGTRPEAIKLSPVVRELCRRSGVESRVCITGQHADLVRPILDLFEIIPDYDLSVMSRSQSLSRLSARIMAGLDETLADASPDLVIVQGDTISTFCGALAAFYAGVPSAHVEAGMRTGNLRHPFPEEANRLLTSRIATLHLAATALNRDNLLAEGVSPDAIVVTGNTGIDALMHGVTLLERDPSLGWNGPRSNEPKRLVLATVHRRESFGEPLERICDAIARLADRGDLRIIFPVHPNPNVRRIVEARLSGVPGVALTGPLNYLPFIDLMRRAELILTDSGGIQEEAPSFGTPVVVLRRSSERREGLASGVSALAGFDPDCIVRHASEALRKPAAKFANPPNPYGDGRASGRIVDASLRLLDTFERAAQARSASGGD